MRKPDMMGPVFPGPNSAQKWNVRFEERTADFGVVSLLYYPEGIILRVGDEVRWRSWKDPALKDTKVSHGQTPQRPGCEVVSRCVDLFNYGETDCDAVYWSDGHMTGGCGDPCSFCMKKGGSGDPPFLREDTILKEIEGLLLRKSRGAFRKGP